MARARLQAQFFVEVDGTIRIKAKPLRRSVARTVFDASDKKCCKCKREVKWERQRFLSDFRQCHIDHILPRSRGGQNNTENLRVLCDSCNLARGAY